jgi:peptidylprolyl isomerase
VKKFASILILSFVLASSGCGAGEAPTASNKGGGSTTISGGPKGRFATITVGEGRAATPRIDPSDLPPPKKVLIRDLEVGKGPVARKGDWVAVYYFGVSYRTGEREYFRWAPSEPWEMTLYATAAWEKSIVGMRAGGRREMIIPSHLAFNSGAMEYIVDLVAVKPASRAQRKDLRGG